MKTKDRFKVLRYLIYKNIFFDVMYLPKDQKEKFIESTWETLNFQWWNLCTEFNRLTDQVKKEIEPALKKILFNGKVK